MPRASFIPKMRGIGPSTSLSTLGMFVWPDDYDTKAEADAVLAFCSTAKITDLYLAHIDYNDPHKVMGQATLSNVTAARCDSITPFEYMIREGAKIGVRCWAWVWGGTFSYWGGAHGCMPGVPDDADHRDGVVYNYHTAIARADQIAGILDFVVCNPGIFGVLTNIEATTASIIAADMTAYMSALKTALTSTIKLYHCSGGSIADAAALKFDEATWLTSYYVDGLFIMGYYDSFELKRRYLATLTFGPGQELVVGMGAEGNYTVASDMRYMWLSLIALGYTSWGFFCWNSEFRTDANKRAVLTAFRAGTLAAVQGRVTKISVTPGVSFTVGIDDVDKTSLWGAETYAGTLKDRVEAEAPAREDPEIWYWRDGSTTTILLGGEYQP